MVRSDLPLGFLAAQIVHAAGESSPGNLTTGTNAVVLSVPDEPALHLLKRRLQGAGVPHVSVFEPDEPWCGSMTAIGLAPVADRRQVRRLLEDLPLLGKEQAAKAA